MAAVAITTCSGEVIRGQDVFKSVARCTLRLNRIKTSSELGGKGMQQSLNSECIYTTQ